jgi:serine/threonine protein kinase
MTTPVDSEQRPADPPPSAAAADDRPLPPGTLLRDYELREVWRSGDSSIVYLAWDRALGRRVAVQEYRPRTLAARQPGELIITPSAEHADLFALGLKAFMAEARLLARFDHPALVRIYRFWEDHGTAYRAMPLYEGATLEEVLADRHQPEAEVRTWLRPLLDAIATLHAGQAWHHHVTPRSVVMTAHGAVLLDMGAARRVVGSLAHGPASVANPGYAAIELYSDAATLAPGPWTDLYALAALAYRAVTGVAPPPASERAARDDLVQTHILAEGRCTARFAAALDATLVLQPERRTQHDADFRALVGGMEATPSNFVPAALPADLMAQPFLAPSRERTVPMTPQSSPPAPLDEMPAAGVVSTQPPPDSRFGRTTRPLPFQRSSPRVSGTGWFGLVAGALLLAGAALYAWQAHVERTTRVASAAEPAASAGAPPAAATLAPSNPSAAPEPTPASEPAPAPRGEPLRQIDVVTPPRDEADRHERCADLLQEATLRRLSAPESAFFMKECR